MIQIEGLKKHDDRGISENHAFSPFIHGLKAVVFWRFMVKIRSVEILKCPACGHEFVVKIPTRICPACTVDMDEARKELQRGTETLYKRPDDASLNEK